MSVTWVKKRLFLVTFILLIGAYFVFHLPQNTPSQQTVSHSVQSQVLGAQGNVALYTQPQSGSGFLIDAIEHAQKDVLVEVYLLSDKSIISALEQAKQRGLVVGVMLEQHPFGGGNLNQKTSQALKDNGVTVVWTNSAFALTHEKTVLIDDSEVFILSQNLTASAFNKNREYDILDTNPTDVAEVKAILKADWDRTSMTSLPSANLLVSPVNSRSMLEQLITSATHSIAIEVEDINDSQIVNLLSQKAKTISVSLLAPTLKQISSNKQSLEKLKAAGVDVRTESTPYIHAKLIIVDGEKAYVGSINLSTQSMDRNREVGIVLGEQDIVQSLQATYQQDFAKGNTLQ